MKRFFYIFLIVVNLFVFSGCMKSRTYTLETLSDKLFNVEIIELEEPGKVKTLYTLDEKETKEVLEFLATIEIAPILPGCNPITITGLCIRLNYADSSSLYVSNYGVRHFENGQPSLLTFEYVVEGEKIDSYIESILSFA